MNKEIRDKQIVVRFDRTSWEKINKHAEREHRSLGEFVRHVALLYIENFEKTNKKGGD
jgi:hypothetical protein